MLSYEEQLPVAAQSSLLNHFVSSSVGYLPTQGHSKKLRGDAEKYLGSPQILQEEHESRGLSTDIP